MSTMTASEAREKLERARSTIRRVNQRVERKAQLTVHAAMTAAGGAGAAVLDRHMPTVAGLDSKMVLGSALALAGVSEIAGQWSDEIMALGSGMLAVSTYQLAQSALATPR